MSKHDCECGDGCGNGGICCQKNDENTTKKDFHFTKVDLEHLFEEKRCSLCGNLIEFPKRGEICEFCEKEKKKKEALEDYKAKIMSSQDPMECIERIAEILFHLENRKSTYVHSPVYKDQE